MREFLEKYHLYGKRVAVGVSGGADSLALALRMAEAGVNVIALSVDHKLRPESRSEADYVAQIMQHYKIEHHILEWSGEKPTSGLEAAAREARYGLMLDFCHCHDIKYLATGHHLRDQAETFLLRLLRGSGVIGLSGIQPCIRRDGIMIIRPQLGDHPDELRQFLQQKNIRWIEDPMNDEENYMRVKIRKFLPELQQIGIDEKRLAATAETLRQTREFLETQRDDFIAQYVRYFGGCTAAVTFARLIKSPREIARLVLDELIRKIGDKHYSPEAAVTNRILQAGTNFKGCTAGGCELLVASKKLWIIPQINDTEVMSLRQWREFSCGQDDLKCCGLPYKVRRAIKIYREKNEQR
ncbi:MAG: tRNA lysidine(34) synthetase TilS [Alphaproteobacteria bacterium]|nr:tRNA lysidine(34) synthetase TilS [Alphaproteobacteria bacterium]